MACLLLLLCVGGASVWQARQNRASLDAARTTRTQLTTAVAILSAVEGAETAQRGFLLTSKDDYLNPYRESLQILPGLLNSLAASRPGDGRVTDLRQAIVQKLAVMAQTVGLARSGDGAGALALVQSDAGQRLMVHIRGTVASIIADLDRILAIQVEDITESDRRLVATQAAGLVMIALLGGLMALGLRRYVADFRHARLVASAAYAALEQSNQRLDEQVTLRTADLLAANEEIQRFAYIVSHDLRAPLINIMGFTAELEQAAGTLAAYAAQGEPPGAVMEAVSTDIPEALRFIKSSTSKMDRLINAILALSREGRRVLRPERIDMGAVIGTIVESMSHQAALKQASVEVGPLPPLEADPLAVEQIFTNLIDNALKYLVPGRPGRVRVTGETHLGMACFAVSDNGRGIAPRDSERVFELFRRAGDQSVPGEGIGLAHVRSLVRRLGGNIEFRSELGTGSTFTVQLPSVARYQAEGLP